MLILCWWTHQCTCPNCSWYTHTAFCSLMLIFRYWISTWYRQTFPGSVLFSKWILVAFRKKLNHCVILVLLTEKQRLQWLWELRSEFYMLSYREFPLGICSYRTQMKALPIAIELRCLSFTKLNTSSVPCVFVYKMNGLIW